MAEEKKQRGLKKLRSNTKDIEPTNKCENCKCNRYSPCYCAEKGKTKSIK